MPISKHAAHRIKNRAIPPAGLDCLPQFGEEEHIGGGVRRYAFSHRTWNRLISYLGSVSLTKPNKTRTAYASVGKDDIVVTAGCRKGELKCAF